MYRAFSALDSRSMSDGDASVGVTGHNSKLAVLPPSQSVRCYLRSPLVVFQRTGHDMPGLRFPQAQIAQIVCCRDVPRRARSSESSKAAQTWMTINPSSGRLRTFQRSFINIDLGTGDARFGYSPSLQSDPLLCVDRGALCGTVATLHPR